MENPFGLFYSIEIARKVFVHSKSYLSNRFLIPIALFFCELFKTMSNFQFTNFHSPVGFHFIRIFRNLKTLVIDNLPKAENKELVSLLLEDELPLLEVRGVEYNKNEMIPTPLQLKEEQESRWLADNIPLYHRLACPETVEVGNLAYCQNVANEKVISKKIYLDDVQQMFKFKKEMTVPVNIITRFVTTWIWM